jgi:hypothetical protein
MKEREEGRRKEMMMGPTKRKDRKAVMKIRRGGDKGINQEM